MGMRSIVLFYSIRSSNIGEGAANIEIDGWSIQYISSNV